MRRWMTTVTERAPRREARRAGCVFFVITVGGLGGLDMWVESRYCTYHCHQVKKCPGSVDPGSTASDRFYRR